LAVTFLNDYIGSNSAATISATNEASGFPDDNLLDINKNILWKCGASTTIIFTIDLGVARACDTIALINNDWNNPTSVTGIKLHTENDDDGAWDSAVTYAIGGAGSWETDTAADQPIWYEEFDSALRRYWRLTCVGCSGAVPHKLGTILLGERVDLSLNYDKPRSLSVDYGVETWETSGGRKFSIKRHDDRQSFALKWSALSSANKNKFTTLWEETEGGHLPFLFKDTDDSLYFVRSKMGGRLPITEDVHQRYALTLNLEEVL